MGFRVFLRSVADDGRVFRFPFETLEVMVAKGFAEGIVVHGFSGDFMDITNSIPGKKIGEGKFSAKFSAGIQIRCALAFSGG